MFAPVTVRRSLSRAARAHAPDDARARDDHMPVLDGLRGVAILLVFLNHAIAGPLRSSTLPMDVAARTVAYAGWVAVDLFFILSGFLITGILLDTRGRPGWWPNFISRLYLRLFSLSCGARAVHLRTLPCRLQWS